MPVVRTIPGRGGRRGPGLLLSLALAAVGIVLMKGTAGAGSIFMKNGYIIQGPIVEHSDSWVVLGWNNGKVTIFRRFVDKVDFEPGEEKNFVRPDESAASPTEDDPLVVTQRVEEEDLPQSLSELVKIYNLPPAFVESRSTPLPDGTEGGTPPEGHGSDPLSPPNDPSDPGSTPALVTDPVTGVAGAPALTLAERTGDPRWGFSIQPPSGWRLKELEGCVSWTGGRSSQGSSPSMNVTSIRRGSLSWEEACRALREDQKSPLKDYELIVEEPLEISGRAAYRVAGRGEPPAAPAGAHRRLTVQQVLVEEGDRLWLISTFVDASLPEDLAMLLDRSVETVRFGT